MAPLGQFRGSCPGPKQHGWGLGGVVMEIRRRCIESPLFLATEVLSCVWMAPALLRTPSDAHLAVEKAIIEQRDLLYVGARGTAKTTVNIETGAVWQLLKFPNDTILLVQGTEPVAKARSSQIRSHFISNPRMKAVFPEYHMATTEEQGDVRSWNVPCRSLVTAEGSFDIGTPGSSRTGNHYVVILCTDLMNPETTPPPCGAASIEEMKAKIAWTAQFNGLMVHKSINPRAHKRFDSNRWHDGDLAGEMLRRDDADQFVKVINGVTKAEDGTYISPWPGVITSEHLKAIHDDPQMTEATWAANFCSDPLPEGGVAFKSEWLHTYPSACLACGSMHKAPKLPGGVAICADPSFADGKTEKKKTDRSGMVVWGTDSDGMVYFTTAKAGRWSADDFVEQLYSLMLVQRPTWVGIEDTGGSRGLKAIFMSRQAREGRFVPYRELKPLGKSKDARAAALHSHAQHFGIFIHDDAKELREELLRYGVMERDDLADAAFYAGMQLYSVPQTKKDKTPLPTIVPCRVLPSGDEIIRRGAARAQNRNRKPWQPRVRTA